jgi:DNA invertase Pin-like site-specific DNA recombinase
MLGVFAEFETNLHPGAPLEGIAKRKTAGVYNDRPASIDTTRVREMKSQGLGATEIAKTLGICQVERLSLAGTTWRLAAKIPNR